MAVEPVSSLPVLGASGVSGGDLVLIVDVSATGPGHPGGTSKHITVTDLALALSARGATGPQGATGPAGP